MKLRIGCFLLAALLLTGCAGAEENGIQKEMNAMTLREKVGQLFVIRPDALEGRFGPAELEDNSIVGTTEVTDEMRSVYARYPAGGFALFRKNILGPEQLRALTWNLHSLNGDRPPLLYIDEEGGRVARIGNHPANFGVPKFEPMGQIGASGSLERAYEAGHTIGSYLSSYGLDVDFAPVADVNTNPLNKVINDRAFGDDPVQVGQMVQQVL